MFQTKADMAYWQMRREILDGTMAPGELLEHKALARRLGLSTTPVREALRRLEVERLVVGRAHKDMCVAELSPYLLAETDDVRRPLDLLALTLAAVQADRAELDAMATLARQWPASNPRAQLQHNRAVHSAIYAACGNEVLIELLDLLWDRSDRYYLVTVEAALDVGQLRDEHIAIADAVGVRNAALASELMTVHLRGCPLRVVATSRSV